MTSNRRPHIYVPLNLPDGAWQIYWYGRLTDVPHARETPFIHTFLSRVELRDGRIVARHPERAKVKLPVSDLTALPLGTVLEEKAVHPALPLHDKATWKNIVVDLTRSNLRVHTRLDGTDDYGRLLGISRKTGILDDDYEGLLVTAGGGAGEHLYIFPSIALFHSFWAISSKWAQMMVDGRFVAYDRYVFSAQRSHISGDGKSALLWLRQWMLDDDARFIASLAFDEYALSTGADIHRHLAQVTRGAARRCIRALPPYQGPVPLEVLQHEVNTSEGPATLIQCIRRCGYASPIENLKFDRDNDGRPLDDALAAEDEDKVPMDRDPRWWPPATTLGDLIELSDQPHDNQQQLVEIKLQDGMHRFPGLDEIETEKLPQTETAYENKEQALIRHQQWVEQVSTLQDGTSSSDLAPEALIRSDEHDEAPEDDFQPVLGSMHELARSLFESKTIEIPTSTGPLIASTRFIKVWARQTDAFFVVPSLVGTEKKAWLYRDPQKKFRKRGLCVEVTFRRQDQAQSVVRYMLDFEGRDTGSGPPKQNSILFFWARRSWALHEPEVHVLRLVRAIAKKGTTRLDRASMSGLEGTTRMHTSTGIENLLFDLYAAEDRMA